MRTVLTAALAAVVLLSGVVNAQPRRPMPRPGPKPGSVIERLQQMTPEDRQRALDRLPPERRAQVEQRLERLNAMPEPARERLRAQYEEFRKLPPEKQDTVRRAFRELNQLPQDRRRVVRRAIMRLRNLVPERRTALMDSEQFKSRFSEAERQLMRELVSAVPMP
jgi:phage-related protein